MPELEGRRLWLAGIGGAGLSAYAVVAKAWGAEVSGWDRNETPYLVHVREAGIRPSSSAAPFPSSAATRAPVPGGSSRRETRATARSFSSGLASL